MDRNHVYRAALAIGLTLFGGCQAHKKSQTNPSASAVESAPASAEKISLDTEGNSATQPDNVDALTRKAEAYAKAMVQMQQTKHASTSTSALSRGDEVRWLDQPDQLSLSNMPPNAKKLEIAMAPEVLVKPVIESTPTVANAPTAAVPKASATAGPIPTQVALIDASKAPLAPAPSPAAVTSGPQNNSALDERLGRLVKDYPKDVSAQFEYQLLQFLENQQVPQMQVLSSLPSEDRELLTAIVDGLSNFRNTIRIDNNMLLSRKVRPILDLAERLRSQAELSIPTLALCSKVSGFGNYEPVEARFPAGKETKVVVYCEVENFSSQKNEKQLWETKLKQQVVLYTETGMQVWQAEPAVANESVRTHRRDFFLVKLITIPQALPVARYVLKVTVEDEQAHRVAEASLPVLIVAQ